MDVAHGLGEPRTLASPLSVLDVVYLTCFYVFILRVLDGIILSGLFILSDMFWKGYTLWT